MKGSPTTCYPRPNITPAVADCRYRAPLTPRLCDLVSILCFNGYVNHYFGYGKGTVLCILAASIGSIIVILLVRRFGKALLEIYFDKEKIENLKFLQSSQKKIIIFLILFIVPGTPKDLLCYYGGLTDIPLPLLIFICTVCRFPSIITSTIGGDALGTGEYGFAIIVFAVTAVISALGIFIYNRFSKKEE